MCFVTSQFFNSRSIYVFKVSISLLIHLPTNVFFCPFHPLSILQTLFLSLQRFTFLLFTLSIHPYTYPSLHLCIYLSIYCPVYLPSCSSVHPTFNHALSMPFYPSTNQLIYITPFVASPWHPKQPGITGMSHDTML